METFKNPADMGPYLVYNAVGHVYIIMLSLLN